MSEPDDRHTSDNAEATVWAVFTAVVLFHIARLPAHIQALAGVRELRNAAEDIDITRAQSGGRIEPARERLLARLAKALTGAAKANVLVFDFFEKDDDEARRHLPKK
jgi:hypothetical protein